MKIVLLNILLIFNIGCSISSNIYGTKASSKIVDSISLTIFNLPTSADSFTALDNSLYVELRKTTGELVNTPEQVKVEIYTNPSGQATLYGTHEVTSSAGIADFSQLAIDLPDTQYQLRFYIEDETEVISDPFDILIKNVSVDPFFPINGANFMDYVPRQTNKRLHEQEDRVDIGSTDNFHGGEVRKILLPEFAECSGLVIEETLDLFHWLCNEEGNDTFIYSRRFKEGKGLRNLLNASSFKSNKVTIKKLGITIAESPLSNTWWTNPIAPLTLNSGGTDTFLNLNSSGTIYTVSASGQSRGIAFTANEVGLVTLGDTTVISNTASISTNLDCQTWPAGFGNQTNCMIVGSGEAGWLEAKINMTLAFRAVYLGTSQSSFNISKNWRIHNSSITTTHGNSYPLYIESGSMKMTDSTLQTNGIAAIRHDNGYYSHFDNISVSGGSIGAIYQGASTWYSIFNRLKVYNTPAGGININGFYKSVLSSKIYNNSGIGVDINTSTDVAVLNSIISNNGGVGLTATDVAIIGGNIISNNSGVGIEVGENSFSSGSRIENNYITNNGVGISAHNSDNWNVSNNILSTNQNSAISITGTSNNLVWTNKLILDSNNSNCSVTTTGPSPGLTNSTCANQGASTATLMTNVDTSDYLNGATSDSANTHTTGTSLFSSITDWVNFSNRFRVWVKSLPDRIGRCSSTNTCEIFDFSLKNTATEALFANGVPTSGANCPSSIHGDQEVEIYFSYALLNTMEIYGDFVGDDNGLCESNEDCLYFPHIGVYQGNESRPLQSCVFQNGTNLTNIKIYFYPEN